MRDADLAVRLVRDAGALAAGMRAEGLDAERKTSVSDIVTAADRAAEALVADALRAERPDDGLLGEEGTDSEGPSGRRWVIDPVDGTFNFHAGLPYWCSALALEDAEGTVLGAVHQPTTGETWVGGRDLPTTLDGVAVEPLVDRPLAEVSLATYAHPPTLGDAAVAEPWLAIVRGAATVRMLGSGSCDLAGVAGGRIGAWAQHSVPAWDWLPGAALVEAAGGRTEVVEHRGLRWHVAGSSETVADVLALLRGA